MPSTQRRLARPRRQAQADHAPHGFGVYDSELGYSQFKIRLEYNADLIAFSSKICSSTSPKDFTLPNDADLHPWDAPAHGNGQDSVPCRPIAAAVQSLDLTPTPLTLRNQYTQDLQSPEDDVGRFQHAAIKLRDIYRELSENPAGAQRMICWKNFACATRIKG